MSILDTFYILFDSDASKLDKGLKESETRAGHLTDKLKAADAAGLKAGASLHELITKSAGLLGIGLSFVAIAHGVRETAKEFNELDKQALRFRDTVDDIDDFFDSAQLLGISDDVSAAALTGLDSAIQDTVLGLGRAKKVFEELGIEVQDAAGKIKPVTVVMGELSERFKTMERGTQIRVMERLGLDPALIKLFNTDLTDMQRRMGEIDRQTGFSLQTAVKRSVEVTKALKELGVETGLVNIYFDTLKQKLQTDAMPFFTKAIELATKAVKGFVEFITNHSNFVEGAIIAIAGAIAYFLVPAAVSGAAAVWAMIAPFALVGAAAAAVVGAFALLYDDIKTFTEGGDSLIGRALERWPALGEVVKEIGAYFKWLWSITRELMQFLITVWDNPGAAFDRFKSGIMSGFEDLLGQIPLVKDAFAAAGQFITDIWEGVLKVIGWVVDGVKAGVDAVKGVIGAAGGVAGLSEGQAMLNDATKSSLSSQTSNSISNSNATSNKSTTVEVGKVEVHTQATDAQAISKEVGDSLRAQLQQALANSDDGVLA